MKNTINLDHIDIRVILDEIGVDYKESGKNIGKSWIGICCPFCGDDYSYHLGICLESPVISCFRCGKKGNVITYLTKVLNSYSKACKLLVKHTPFALKQRTTITSTVKKVSLPNNCSKQISQAQKAYLKQRRYNHEVLTEKYDLYFCSPVGEWANRIIVPVYQNRTLITFTSIDIHPNSPLRYKHLPEDQSILSIKKYLYGLNTLKNNAVIVVEGLFDKFRIGNNCVCTFGTNITGEQIKLLSNFRRVIICFDGDKAGRTAAKHLSNNLSIFCETLIVELDDGEDPDTMKASDIKQLQNLI